MASGVNQTELIIFLFMVVSIPIIILALCNIPRIQEWYNNVRGRMSREPPADVSESVEDVNLEKWDSTRTIRVVTVDEPRNRGRRMCRESRPL